MEITRKTIIDNIQDKNVDKLATIAFESIGGSAIDYKTFFDMVDVYAKGFKELGINNGDIVTICSAGTLDTVLNFFALNKIGAVAQFVNPNYFKYNGTKYINDTNSKLFICLDRFYPEIKDAIAETNIDRILLSSISEYSSLLFKIIARRKKINSADRIDGKQYIELPEFIKLGENSSIHLDRIPYEADKPAVITYTSGTTGNPKGVIHTNDSINNMIHIYSDTNGFGLAGNCRNLVLIPPMYLTSLVHSIITPTAMNSTSILQPIYDPTTLGRDLLKYKPNLVVASKSHYINMQDAKWIPKGALSATKNAYCGGEAISRDTAVKINEILDYYGMPPMIIGYGQTEFGTMTMFSNDIPTRTNESGILIPGVEAKILDPRTGKPVKKGERGELYISTPAIMKEYINNPTDTEKFFTIDENGKKWGRTGDIAEVKYQYGGKDVYEVSGRANDSFIDSDGNMVYLFDIETKIEGIKYVREAEVVAVTIDGKKVPIVHIVLDEKVKNFTQDVLSLIDELLKNTLKNKNAIPYAYKIRDSFNTSPISGKRDYASLKYETDGFYVCDENGKFLPITIDSEESKSRNELLESRIGFQR